MEASPAKRALTHALYKDTHAAQLKPQHQQLLSDDLIAQLQNVGRRVRYNVSQGYASNRTTPFSTPNSSPSKAHPVNPYNTPEPSPLRKKLFQTEVEVIQEATGELDLNKETPDSAAQESPRKAQNERKRRRAEEEESDEVEMDVRGDAEEKVTEESQRQDKSQKRVVKSLPSKKVQKTKGSAAPVPVDKDDDEDASANPFLVKK